MRFLTAKQKEPLPKVVPTVDLQKVIERETIKKAGLIEDKIKRVLGNQFLDKDCRIEDRNIYIRPNRKQFIDLCEGRGIILNEMVQLIIQKLADPDYFIKFEH